MPAIDLLDHLRTHSVTYLIKWQLRMVYAIKLITLYVIKLTYSLDMLDEQQLTFKTERLT